MNKLFSALILLFAARPALAARTIMEQTAASNNAVFVDTQNARVGISTNAPVTTLDVGGNAQFGTTAKSTFSTAGALTLATPLLSSSGGTGQTATIGNGGLLIGNATTGLSTGTLTAAGQMSVTNAAGKITLNTVGVSSTCAAGQYGNSSIVVNGIQTNVTCTAAGVGDVTSTANNNFSGAGTVQTFGSSVTFNGLTTIAGGVVSNNKIHKASVNNSFSASDNVVTLNTCYSTITVTTGANPMLVWYTGSMETLSNSVVRLESAFLMDGARQDTGSNTSPLVFVDNLSRASTAQNMSWQFYIPAVTAATHSFCVLFATDTAATWHACNSVVATGGAICQFGVMEIK